MKQQTAGKMAQATKVWVNQASKEDVDHESIEQPKVSLVSATEKVLEAARADKIEIFKEVEK